MSLLSSSVQGKQFGVTGGSGFVGRRLVEMLVERGASRVVSLDIREPLTVKYPQWNPLSSEQEKKIQYVLGDISNEKTVLDAFVGVDAVFHIAAAVGPFLPHPVFHKVNVVGTENVIKSCQQNKVSKLVASSSPSIFFDGSSISGSAPKELKVCQPGKFLATYAATKAEAEVLVRNANNPPTLFTINVAPHQVYGPRDTLFMPNFLFKKDQLRIMGDGKNRVSFTHVDNYCHGMILALDVLYEKSPALGKFYLVTDLETQLFWKVLDRAVVRNGGVSVFSKFKVPTTVMYCIAYAAQLVGKVLGTQFRLSPFNVRMLTINRYFNIEDTTRDLKYVPLKTFEQGWEETLQWFQGKQEFIKVCAENTIPKKD